MESENTPRIIFAGDGKITIGGLTQDNIEKIMAAINSDAYYIRISEKKIEAVPRYQPLPSPMEDSTMLPFWRMATKEEVGQFEIFGDDACNNEVYYSPVIIIQGLCGYYYTPEKYKYYAEKLVSYGFDCLRSRRGEDGKFWELWYMPLFLARGELGTKLSLVNESETEERKNAKLKMTVEFIREEIQFGSLDVTVQKLAMATPD